MLGHPVRMLQASVVFMAMLGIAIGAAPTQSIAAESPAPGAKPASEQKPKPKPRAAKRAAKPAAEAAMAAPAATVISPRYNDVMTAVLKRDQAGAAETLRAGMSVDRPDTSGMTPLMVAAMQGDPDMTALLLKHGADPNRRGPAGGLHTYAGMGGNGKVVELLTKAGAR